MKIYKKGMNAQGLLLTLFGLLIASQFLIALLPTIISNLSDTNTFTGTYGSLLTTTLPLLVIAGIIFYFIKGTGFSGKGK